MPGYNKVVLIGHLTRDPQFKYLPNQTPLAEFGLAINRKFTKDGEKKEDVLFIDCAVFGKQAEVIQKYCTKGKALMVDGRLKLDTWDAKDGGGKRSKISVVVDNFQMLGSGQQSDSNGGEEDPVF
jgi:single-strand DNA-binding protein